MPRGKKLSHDEQIKILTFNEAGMSGSNIARKIGRSKAAVNSFLRNPEDYGSKKRTGRPKSLTARQSRQIRKLACGQKMSSSQIQEHLQLPCTSRTVRNVLSNNPIVQFKKFKGKPPLSQHHKNARLHFARKHLTEGTNWRDVVFSDEKKFNFDGPDGYKYFWHDLRQEPHIFSKRQFGGGCVMVWAAFAAGGTIPIVFMPNKMNSIMYQDMLGDNLLPIAPLITSGDWTFQQDNASVHVSKSTKAWLEANQVKCLEWPARSPDLNVIENLWGILARNVYKNGRQFNSKLELMNAIKNCWNNIDASTLCGLIDSMNKRLVTVIEKKGSHIDY